MRVHALASGSSGNAVLIQVGSTNLLIDAGLPVRTLAAHLARHHVGIDNLHAILLTHEHTDHASGAGPLARRTHAPVVANAGTLEACAGRDELPFPTMELPTGSLIEIGGVEVRSFPVPHDAVDAVGFVIRAAGQQVTYFTDAGSITPAIRSALAGANLAIVESNHDEEWLRRGPYTPQMKARVASATGHLSNRDCADLLAERLESGGPMSVWLAHLSRVNNSPKLARRSVLARIAERSRVPVALDIALRDHPSISWHAGVSAIQLSLL